MLNDLLTGKDNTTHDMGRWSWLGTFVAIIAATAWNAVHGAMIDIIALATALGGSATAHGVALMAKKGTEPDAEPDVKP
ncbi:hypothetical protein UFOVP147_48 [uncultured Caudovirales phage]|uniref:Holin n=1 Tax=uncultured Caudovirales phage TaxID=2100421 RepID=A0A6J7W272_9CAUD|nr:hypothetical protein UFOVP147_48 [uncultured Caudovirales phage]